MNKSNHTVSEFLLLGFPDVTGFRAIILFTAILLVYIVTLMINSMVMVLVSIKPQLHSPMYFFLQQLSFSEFVFLTIVIPNMLHVIWLEGATISVRSCIIQAYLYCASGCTECHLLTVMAYDRYLAICRTLHYHTIMDTRLQKILVIYCWFCGPYVINHFFCDLAPFVELTCSLKTELKLMILIGAVPIMVIPFISVIISYLCVFITILGISSAKGRKKTFSTCSSHLTVVTMYYGTLNTIYMVPANGDTLTLSKLLSFLYIAITPLFNPIIYCLRNQEMRAVIEKLFRVTNNRCNAILKTKLVT
ncbi:hypothetical protein GDO78_004947 [Eleutherodactylus coqui]|uniref:Olfactory receptor n=1 Tax=Eleutherodactylus coqui TaxID=57060 RepID=A0A8J6KD91_ELECQ|nr:hypothetical protein GDO78_004947 [Eleutherodactylus coqui]